MARQHLKLEGHTNISDASEFRSGNYSLVEGVFPSVGGDYEVLISDRLAELNGFELGDILEISQKRSEWGEEAMNMEEEDYFDNVRGPYECKIVGIYAINVGGEYSKMASEEDIPANTIFGTYSFLNELKDPLAPYEMEDEQVSHKYLNATFFVKDASQLDRTISKLLKNKVVDGTYFKIYKDNTAFSQSSSALKNMRIITWIMTILILGGGISLLLLLEKMWLEGRKRETGIYLAAGIGKGQILSQYFLEQALCLLPAIVMSAILSICVAPKLGQLLFQASGGKEEVLLQGWRLNVGWMPVFVVTLSFIFLCIIGTLILGKRIVEMKPRDLFSNLSIPMKTITGWKKHAKKEQEAKKGIYSRWERVVTYHHYDCNNWKWRAVAYLVRNRNRTIGMFMILLLTGTLVLSSLVIQTVAIEGKSQLASTIGASFQINTAEGRKVTHELAEEVDKLEGIRSYNTTSISYPATKDLQLIPGQFAGSGEIWEKVPRVVSCNENASVHFFRDEEVKIKEGYQIVSEDESVCLISEDLAKLNGLTLGDTIILWLAEELEPVQTQSINEEKKVEIIGIYSIETTDLVSDAATEADKYANMIFTDAKTGDSILNGLYGGEEGQVNDNAEFFLSNPEQINSILTKIQTDFDVSEEQLTKNDKEYQESAASLTQLESVMKILEKTTIFISVFILALILTLWSRERIQEIGIYLAGGIGKREIILQMLSEKLLIGLAAFLSATIVVAVFGTTLEQWMKNSVTKETADSLSNIQVFPDIKVLFLSFGIEMGIILLAVGVSLLVVMRFKPKHILSQMSE